MKKIKWAICDDASYYCYIHKTRLEDFDNLEFVGSCQSAKEAKELVLLKKPDVLLMDIQMETQTAGIDILPSLKEASPDLKIIMLTSHDDEKYIYDSFVAGADNYLLKDTVSSELIASSITDTFNGDPKVSSKIAQILADRAKNTEKGIQSLLYVFEIMSKLSQSEYEILKMLYNGCTYSEISKKRFVAESTVRNHITRILSKFDNYHSMKNLISDLHELRIFDYIK